MPNMFDRLAGASSSLASKAPCLVATTANITLSGEQTIDGVAVQGTNGAGREADRVLVKAQTNAAENGIYEVSTGPWQRSKDFDGNNDFRKGTWVYVTGGAISAGAYLVSSDTDPQTFEIDEDEISFTLAVSLAAREVLSADRTYYVSTTGSDSNDGLSGSTPFASVTKAFTTIRDTLDLAGFTVTVSMADGTYTAEALITRPWTGRGSVILEGNVSNPANVIISTTGSNCVSVTGGAVLNVRGFEVRSTTSGYGLDAGIGGRIHIIGVIRFGTMATGYAHIVCDSLGTVLIQSDYSIVGSAGTHWFCFENGMIECQSRTITLSGTPAFSVAFARVYRGGHISVNDNTYSGSATGSRFLLENGGSIFTNNAGLTALPGNAAGTILGGQYDNLGADSTHLVGTTATSVPALFDETPQLQVGSTSPAIASITRYSTDTFGGRIDLLKSKTDSAGSHAIVSSGDFVGDIFFGGSDGTAFRPAARISAIIDGTPGSNDMPGRLGIFTSPDGSGNPVERVRIDNAGNVLAPYQTAALSTSATNGLLYIPTSTAASTAAPIGTPTSYTGMVPMIYNTAQNRLWVFSGGSWRASSTFST